MKGILLFTTCRSPNQTRAIGQEIANDSFNLPTVIYMGASDMSKRAHRLPPEGKTVYRYYGTSSLWTKETDALKRCTYLHIK